MTPIDLEMLKKLAQSATPGPWESFSECDLVEWDFGDETCLTSGYLKGLKRHRVTHSFLLSDTDFIAAANPQTVLALIEEIEELREYKEQHEKCIINELELMGTDACKNQHDYFFNETGCSNGRVSTYVANKGLCQECWNKLENK